MNKIVTGLAALVLSGCVHSSVGVHPSFNPEQRLVFQLDHNPRVNYIHSIKVWEDGADEYLWVHHFKKPSSKSIVYGDDPNFSNQRPFPRIPSRGISPRLPRQNEPFYIEIEYQWDKLIPPIAAVSSKDFIFIITDDYKIQRIRSGHDSINRPKRSKLTNEWDEWRKGLTSR